MKFLLKAFRNFFLIFALFVVLAIILSKSEEARKFVTPGGQPVPPEFETPKEAE
jgi:hypothetical protein